MNGENKNICNLQSEIDRLRLELDETYRSVTELTNELEVKNEKLIKANKLINEQQVKLVGEARLKATLEMAGAAAHELAQPLTVVMGRCELLEMYSETNPALAKHIKSIMLCIGKMGRIIHKIQDIRKYIVKEYVNGSTIIDIEKGS